LFFSGKLKTVIFVLLFCFSFASLSWARWQPVFSKSKYYPPLFFIVSKKEQKLYVFAHNVPIKTIRCTTGKNKGDKQKRGDLKTPEGVYFIEAKINHNLDFTIYGGKAFTLNYPNPIDVLRQKTGFGIWLHGRGRPIQNFNTKGCIAINLDQLNDLEKFITLRQTPLIITSDFTWDQNPNQTELFQKLSQKFQKWLLAWRGKKTAFFKYYSPQLVINHKKQYSFFIKRKKKLFRKYGWIDVFVSSLAILPGPNYIVTYFKQLFRAPGFISMGIKRLYWQRVDGTFKIVGEEWRPLHDQQLKHKYIHTRRKEILSWLNKWRKAWLNANLLRYLSFYSPMAKQQKLPNLHAIKIHKQKLWAKCKPKQISFSKIKVDLHSKGFIVQFKQSYANQCGYRDQGLKILILKPSQNSWKIVKESWKKIKKDGKR